MIAETGLALLIPAALIYALNALSYGPLKRRIIRRRRWGLNLCCGTTDGGGVNADIVKHRDDLPGFVRVTDLSALPFDAGQFDDALCSHTAEHVDDPDALDRELRRVARTVVYIVPPLWDLAAVLNVFEHKWIFLTLRKRHTRLPRYVRLPLARTVQKVLGQRIAA